MGMFLAISMPDATVNHQGRSATFTPASLLTGFFVLLVAATLFASPPGAAPDESAHYLKARAVGQGHLILDRAPRPEPPDAPIALKWLNTEGRVVTIPADQSPDSFSCWRQPFYVGLCRQPGVKSSAKPIHRPPDRLTEFTTYVGRYPPYSYVIPGLVMKLGRDPRSALMWARAAQALLCLALLNLAVMVLSESGKPLALLGLIAGATPMVVYLASTLSSNGVEIAAGACVTASVMRLSRPSPPPRWLWAAFGFSGAALGVIRELGPVWLGLNLVLLVALLGPRRLGRLVRSGGRPAAAAAGLVVCAGILGTIWQRTQAAHPPMSASLLLEIPGRFGKLPELLKQAVGYFGALDTPLPPTTYAVAGLLFGGIVVVALAISSNRQRLILVTAIAAVVMVTLGVDAAEAAVGWGAQARHLLPLAVALPILTGELISRNQDRAPGATGLVLPLVIGGSLICHLTGWYTLARRYSVGLSGPAMFISHAKWSPPLGWWVWAAVATAGICLLIMSGYLDYRDQSLHSLAGARRYQLEAVLD
jgi:hypothetical protein